MSLRGRLTCHCLLVETNDALVLIDTGFGLRDVADPRARLSRFFLTLLSPDFREELTAIRQIAALDDFPHARVHMLSKEREVAEAQRTLPQPTAIARTEAQARQGRCESSVHTT